MRRKSLEKECVGVPWKLRIRRQRERLCAPLTKGGERGSHRQRVEGREGLAPSPGNQPIFFSRAFRRDNLLLGNFRHRDGAQQQVKLALYTRRWVGIAQTNFLENFSPPNVVFNMWGERISKINLRNIKSIYPDNKLCFYALYFNSLFNA